MTDFMNSIIKNEEAEDQPTEEEEGESSGGAENVLPQHIEKTVSSPSCIVASFFPLGGFLDFACKMYSGLSLSRLR